ncbi:NgoMIV family type II restriction endonuclease [Desulfonatronum thioautotrophicum]|uniref:NgoMIV family type II restriction endonuclease n=1 Tax=Desulfonatronum thioautotrophicum TaxID=617001 RepID=UPI00069AC25A|nr:NgoMIV family type II restriction endonuclease [Desulfonatronum thioautotrophicum]
MKMEELRELYHRRVCSEIIRLQKDGDSLYPNFADKGSKASRAIASGIVERIGYTPNYVGVSGQTAGGRFEIITKEYLQATFELLGHLRPGKWSYSTQTAISLFAQYEHLASIERIILNNNELAAALGTDYIIKPDIVIGRYSVSDEEINRNQHIIGTEDFIAGYTPIRRTNSPEDCKILHASISCKWTLRSDRSQNARTEALNLIRNRKGRLPHVVAITAESLPTRIASLALGTGDMDCVYHFALRELHEVLVALDNEDQLEMLMTLIEGRRIRDISDLPFDLAI